MSDREDDYCELCDLKFSNCVHGMPKPVAPAEPPKAVRKPRVAKPEKPEADKVSPARVTTSTPRAARRWTAPADFMPHIVAVLDEAGQALSTEDALARIEERMADQLRPGDLERSPQGELRWRTAARKARLELVNTGLLSADQPGVWQLND
ncbi:MULTISPECIES: hypothetical protein [unclassified Nocardioides]|uniref:hypothetical protein n=1 Tax=unclassified Nocardioides TaxID=2615069 RepID=UPI0006FBBEE2|nr:MULTISPECIES: hypothetical protein [unclassified Nocardioides]KQY51640.1 hypothetical protein ASD30_19945 [Nocardioides sp. Root140]KRF10958.1 hypothetical protein ASH02_19145 [Nocardioides sp. Soil796]